MRPEIYRFLQEHGMHYDTLDIEKETGIFAAEMKKGLSGKNAGLMMIPSYLETERPVPRGETAVVADAGGTHLRVASVTFSRETGVPVIEQFKTIPMPGTQGAVTAESFFESLSEQFIPRIGTNRKIGFCFSYPARILPNLDGKILKLAKEITIQNAEGLLIGEELNKAFARHGQKPCKAVVLNDSTAGLLGGMAQSQAYDDYIGFILGTGTNTCYIENAENITGLSAREKRGRMIVNLESGCYPRIAQGDVDRELDSESRDPGGHKLEKMVSGGYFGAVLRRTLEKAGTEGLFSLEFCRLLREVPPVSMRDVDAFCDNPQAGGLFAGMTDETDHQTLLAVIDTLFERAARLSIIQIGGILSHTGAGRNPQSPVCVVAEGTFFTKSRIFRSKFDRYTQSFLEREMGRYIEPLTAPNATLVGAAAAALIS